MRRYTFRLAVALFTLALGLIANSAWFSVRSNYVLEAKQTEQDETALQPEARAGKSKPVPGVFKGVDFRNYQYSYQFSYGAKFKIALNGFAILTIG